MPPREHTTVGYVFFKTFKFFSGLDAMVQQVGSFGISRGLFLWILFLGLMGVLSIEIPHLALFSLLWLGGTAPVWLLIGLYLGAINSWIWYGQSRYLAGRKPILLEMKVPREIHKSPRAMEIALTALTLSSGETTFINRAWQGQVRPFFSLELASFGGEVHFYIWCWDNYKSTVEATMYAQYPEIELEEVEDYATRFRFDPEKHDCWGVEWPRETYIGIRSTDFRINAYPIRTYEDFELVEHPDEEDKVDPMAQVIEFLSALQPNEQIWIQLVIRKAGKRGIFHSEDDDEKWKDMVEKEVEKMRKESVLHAPELGSQARAAPSWRYQEVIKNMERNLGKYPFEFGGRGIYWAEGRLRGPIFTGMRWIWRPFGNPQDQTQLRPRRWHCDFDFPWQDFHDIRWTKQTRRVHDAYRRRSFFHTPWILPTNILTNEEIATIWHPPIAGIESPGLQRIPAKKAEAPHNLPTE